MAITAINNPPEAYILNKYCENKTPTTTTEPQQKTRYPKHEATLSMLLNTKITISTKTKTSTLTFLFHRKDRSLIKVKYSTDHASPMIIINQTKTQIPTPHQSTFSSSRLPHEKAKTLC